MTAGVVSLMLMLGVPEEDLDHVYRRMLPLPVRWEPSQILQQVRAAMENRIFDWEGVDRANFDAVHPNAIILDVSVLVDGSTRIFWTENTTNGKTDQHSSNPG